MREAVTIVFELQHPTLSSYPENFDKTSVKETLENRIDPRDNSLVIAGDD
jgi:hypothetical protein